MKLLIYSHFFAPSIGGVENAVMLMATGLTELRALSGEAQFQVTVVTQTAEGNFDSSSLAFKVLRRPGALRLWRAIRDTDVLHISGPALPPLILAWLARVPVVIEHHGYQAICPNGLLVHQPDRAICPGHFQERHFIECLRCRATEISSARSVLSLALMFPRQWLVRRAARNLGISEHVVRRHRLPRSSVAYYGIEDPLKNGFVPALQGPSERVVFAYVGRFFPEKGIPVLLRAAERLKKEGLAFEVRLIGDGPQRREIEQIIASSDLGDCVHITGYLTGAALARAVQDVCAVVMPSVCEETAGLSAIEQMMRGRLVIASEIGGLAEVVGEVGLTFPAGDSSALAERMKSVLRNPSLASEFGKRARPRAVNLFTRDKMVAQHAEVYREVLGASAMAHPSR